MTLEVLEKLRWYIKETGRASHIAAQNSRMNGYVTVALKHENEAVLADMLLTILAQEGREPDAVQIESAGSVL
jgi:hypothetical protein